MTEYRNLTVAILLAVTCLMFGCGSDKKSSTGPDGVEIVPTDYVAGINSTYFPLVPGTTFVYDAPGEHNEVEVTSQTKVILGVTCIVVHDRVWIDGELEEDTLDWYAQHKNGDVWYFGEDSKEIENGQVVSTEGSWEAGVDDAEPGILIKANPQVGDSYRQEYYEGEAEDMADVVALDASVTVSAGTYQSCLKTREWTPLEPSASEYKYYAVGVGLVKEESTSGGGGGLELVEVRHPQR